MGDSTTKLAKLAEIGINSMREMRRMRESPTRILKEKQTPVLEETVQEEELVVLDEESAVDPEDIVEETIPEEIVTEENAIIESIVDAYNSNEDYYPDLENVRMVAKLIQKQLNNYSDDEKLLRAAVLITHLSTNTYVGSHSYTFRKEVVVDGIWDVSRLLEGDYIWPEVYNNALMDVEMKNKYEELDKSEVSRVMDILRTGKQIPNGDGMICYTTPSNACNGLRTCKITANKEIIIPGMENSKPVGFCFKREVLYDIFLTQKVPINPRTGEEFPPILVQGVYKKYKGELLMRTYYLETILDEQSNNPIVVSKEQAQEESEQAQEESEQAQEESEQQEKSEEEQLSEIDAQEAAEDQEEEQREETEERELEEAANEEEESLRKETEQVEEQEAEATQEAQAEADAEDAALEAETSAANAEEEAEIEEAEAEENAENIALAVETEEANTEDSKQETQQQEEETQQEV